jgi:hypothetical protein
MGGNVISLRSYDCGCSASELVCSNLKAKASLSIYLSIHPPIHILIHILIPSTQKKEGSEEKKRKPARYRDYTIRLVFSFLTISLLGKKGPRVLIYIYIYTTNHPCFVVLSLLSFSHKRAAEEGL